MASNDRNSHADRDQNGVSRSNHLKKRIYTPSSSPKLESSAVTTFIPFSLARERQFAAISAKALSAN